MENEIIYREKIEEDNNWVGKIATEQWGSKEIISGESIYNVLTLPGVIASQNNEQVGVILYALKEDQCEIVALYSGVEKKGIGTKLIELVKDKVIKEGCKRLWLLTTNDNTQALRFYQKRGFVLSALRPNVIKEQRKIKSIPLVGNDGIPIRDEIELEMSL